MNKTAYSLALAGALVYVTAPLEPGFDVREAPEAPSMASVAKSTATGGYDAYLDAPIDLRPHHVIVAPST